ncbi:NAD(P)H-binding protein, partial [Streptomyces sp. NPDC002454]
MTYLVTGATGSIGRRVVRELAGRGVALRALTRDPGRARGLPGGVEVVAGDAVFFGAGEYDEVSKIMGAVRVEA